MRNKIISNKRMIIFKNYIGFLLKVILDINLNHPLLSRLKFRRGRNARFGNIVSEILAE